MLVFIASTFGSIVLITGYLTASLFMGVFLLKHLHTKSYSWIVTGEIPLWRDCKYVKCDIPVMVAEIILMHLLWPVMLIFLFIKVLSVYLLWPVYIKLAKKALKMMPSVKFEERENG